MKSFARKFILGLTAIKYEEVTVEHTALSGNTEVHRAKPASDGHDLDNSIIIGKRGGLLPGNQSIGHSFISIIFFVFILFCSTE